VVFAPVSSAVGNMRVTEAGCTSLKSHYQGKFSSSINRKATFCSGIDSSYLPCEEPKGVVFSAGGSTGKACVELHGRSPGSHGASAGASWAG